MEFSERIIENVDNGKGMQQQENCAINIRCCLAVKDDDDAH